MIQVDIDRIKKTFRIHSTKILLSKSMYTIQEFKKNDFFLICLILKKRVSFIKRRMILILSDNQLKSLKERPKKFSGKPSNLKKKNVNLSTKFRYKIFIKQKNVNLDGKINF